MIPAELIEVNFTKPKHRNSKSTVYYEEQNSTSILPAKKTNVTTGPLDVPKISAETLYHNIYKSAPQACLFTIVSGFERQQGQRSVKNTRQVALSEQTVEPIAVPTDDPEQSTISTDDPEQLTVLTDDPELPTVPIESLAEKDTFFLPNHLCNRYMFQNHQVLLLNMDIVDLPPTCSGTFEIFMKLRHFSSIFLSSCVFFFYSPFNCRDVTEIFFCKHMLEKIAWISFTFHIQYTVER